MWVLNSSKTTEFNWPKYKCHLLCGKMPQIVNKMLTCSPRQIKTMYHNNYKKTKWKLKCLAKQKLKRFNNKTSIEFKNKPLIKWKSKSKANKSFKKINRLISKKIIKKILWRLKFRAKLSCRMVNKKAPRKQITKLIAKRINKTIIKQKLIFRVNRIRKIIGRNVLCENHNKTKVKVKKNSQITKKN